MENSESYNKLNNPNSMQENECVKCHSEGNFEYAGTKKDAFRIVTASRQHDILGLIVPLYSQILF